MFEHDTEVALANAAALVNTQPTARPGQGRPELLPDTASLASFLEEWQWSAVPTLTPDVLHRVHTLRPRLRELWTAELPEQVMSINALLSEFQARPRLVRHDPYGWHVHATDDDAPLHARMAVEAAMAMVDLVRASETDRLRLCAAGDCDRVLVDLSRNRSKAYCDAGCANRAHAAAYRARRARS
jgi:predicted RNA-binding Zn ribbon-like protein